MCYNTVLTKKRQEITSFFKTPFYNPEFYEPYYANNGFDHGYLYIIPQNRSDLIFPARWGLVPEFDLSEPSRFWKKQNTLNARSEDVFEKRTYKKSVQSQRCLIIADGFYEPHHYQGKSQPYFCFIPGGTKIEDRQLFCYAGIYTSDGEGSYYASLLTTEANEFFAEIHNKIKRMPLVLDRGLGREWLLDLSESQVKELMRNGFTKEAFDAYPVSNNLYKKNFDSNIPEILHPVPPIEPPSLF